MERPSGLKAVSKMLQPTSRAGIFLRQTNLPLVVSKTRKTRSKKFKVIEEIVIGRRVLCNEANRYVILYLKLS